MDTAISISPAAFPVLADVLPVHRELYYGGAWHAADGGETETVNPGTGESLGRAAAANATDVDRAVAAAQEAFGSWRQTKPNERAAMMREIAVVLRAHAEELALIDAANCGNAVTELVRDAHASAHFMEMFAGLIPAIRGETVPFGGETLHMTMREPWGVCARILAYNHPLMFLASKAAPALAVGNTVIMKPPPQAPLSAYRFAELIDGILPPGVFNVLTGGVECGAALTSHPDIPVVTLIGSAPTGRAIMKAAADRLKHLIFELGGKNASIIYPDADPKRAIEGAIRGMNFGWCGQSCGSTSRLFIHESLHDEILAGIVAAAARFRPGLPTHRATTMGAIVSRAQYDKVLRYIEIGKAEGARLVTGGGRPVDPALDSGFFVEPTIFADVRSDMRIAQEEIFGPVLSVLKWRDEDTLFDEVNSVEYGLTGAVFTRDLATAHRAAARIQSGYIWINDSSRHFPGVPFGGYKQSGIGREECFDELLSFTQQKTVNLTL